MLNYRIEGKGSPLLLCHGFGISFNIWEVLSPLLSDHHTLIIVELPGIGSSPPPSADRSYLAAAVEELESLRAALNIPRWSLLGYSSGSRVVECYIQVHASRVDRAVFLCPAYVTKGRATGLRIAIELDELFPAFGNWVLSENRLRFLIRLLAFNLERNPSINNWYREISSQPVEMLKETLKSLPQGGCREFVVPAQVPSLFIWGRQDWITRNPPSLSSRDVMITATHSAPQTSAREVANSILFH